MIISISVPEELAQKLKSFASVSERTVSSVVCQAIRQLLPDPLAKPATFAETPTVPISTPYIEYDTTAKEPPASPQHSACQRCLNLGRACSAHRDSLS